MLSGSIVGKQLLSDTKHWCQIAHHGRKKLLVICGPSSKVEVRLHQKDTRQCCGEPRSYQQCANGHAQSRNIHGWRRIPGVGGMRILKGLYVHSLRWSLRSYGAPLYGLDLFSVSRWGNEWVQWSRVPTYTQTWRFRCFGHLLEQRGG